MLQKEKAAALLHSSLEDQNLDALLGQNVRRRGGEHRNTGVGVGSVVGGQGLHVGVHGLGHLLGDGYGLHDGAPANTPSRVVLPSSLTVSRPRWLVSMPVVVLTREFSEPWLTETMTPVWG